MEPQKIVDLLSACSDGNEAETAHRLLSGICKKVLRISSSPLSLGKKNSCVLLEGNVNFLLNAFCFHLIN